MSAAPYVEQPRAILDGVIQPGALLYFYESGTLFPLVTIYADPQLTAPLKNPLQADIAGRWPAIYLDQDAYAYYRAQCIAADGVTLIFDDLQVDPHAAPYSRPGAALDASGVPLDSASMTFYAERTSIRRDIYDSGALSDELPNPVTADAAGVFPDIWMDTSVGYRVLQHNAAGELIYDIGFISGVPPQAPLPPVLSGFNDTSGNHLSWTSATPGSFPVSYYELEKSDDQLSWTVIATVTAGDPLQYLDEDVPGSSTFFYRVRAFDTAGTDSGYSNTVELQSAATDPYWLDVVILLTADTGVLTEWSGLPDVWAVVGDGALSDVQVKFGARSFRNPGSVDLEDFVYFEDGPASTLLTFPGEYTFEAWFLVVAEHRSYMNFWSSATNAGGLQYAIQTVSNRLLYKQATGGADTVFPSSPTYAAYMNKWTHVAVSRDASNVVRLFLDGVVIGSSTISGTVNSGLGTPRIGLCAANNASDNSDCDTYVDQFRVTKKCRYTSNFSVPTAPFPKTGP